MITLFGMSENSSDFVRASHRGPSDHFKSSAIFSIFASGAISASKRLSRDSSRAKGDSVADAFKMDIPHNKEAAMAAIEILFTFPPRVRMAIVHAARDLAPRLRPAGAAAQAGRRLPAHTCDVVAWGRH